MDCPAVMRKFGSKLYEIAFRLRHRIALTNRKYTTVVDRISERSELLKELSDSDLKSHAKLTRDAFLKRETQPSTIELMAVAREVAARTVGLRPYDVQLLAALALHDQKCVEMYTGEGKTLAAALAVCLRARAETGVHILTFNDYLAGRDADWMRPFYAFFGLTVGSVQEGMTKAERKAGYGCDVTYVTAKEAGFDYLRDESCEDVSQRVHRGFPFAIVDEADSSLIDEARIPLVLATEDERDDTDLYRVATLIGQQQHGRDFVVQTNGRNCTFTDFGIASLERTFGCGQLHSEANVGLLSRLNVALHAQVLLKRDIDYIVRDGRIELIDEFTGRVADNRRWPGGIQAALEAKESLKIEPQGRILNSITMQYFLELYDGLSGMSGTAQESTGELDEFYDLKVVVVPPNRSWIRVDHADRVFVNKQAKLVSLVNEIRSEHARRRPVLVGTASVDESEQLANALSDTGVLCRVLNAANDFEEAEIIAEAGALGAVTISTNMAGRGTDIKLGGSDERQRDEVVALGGLYVIGTNRNESRRIDNQLRGRSGRQGDPGESRFFVSLEDSLLSRFGAENIAEGQVVESDGSLSNPEVANRIAHLQRVIEGQSFDIRRLLRKYAFLLERQRREVAELRSRLIHRKTIPTYLRDAKPEFYRELIDRWGEPLINESESRVAVRHIDRCWSDHLEHAAQIRENIHLVSLGGFNAFYEFNKEMNREYRSLLKTINDLIIETMTTAVITPNGIDLDNEGLKAPSSTWTYMITDNPKGGVLSQLTKGIGRLINNWREQPAAK
ncbi:MAG: accessory Sec system translocase SecA2 [Planctomycetaceae bacterium]